MDAPLARRRVDGCCIELHRGDLSAMVFDAVVNAANEGLVLGSGVAGAIRRRGGPSIQAECDRLGGCPTGGAVATTGGDLPARWVVHAVGPRRGDPGAEALLESAVGAAIRCAFRLGAASVALPALSTGHFGFPLDRCADLSVATAVRMAASRTAPARVAFCLWEDEALSVFREALDRRLPAPAARVADADCLLLDFDGVLADSEAIHHRCCQQALGPDGPEVSWEEYRLHWVQLGTGLAGEIARRKLSGVDTRAWRDERWRLFRAACLAGEVRLYPDAERLLRVPSRSGPARAIVSNTGADEIAAVLDAAGVGGDRPRVFGGAGLPGKPRADLYQSAVRELGFDPARCVVVEDTWKGCVAAAGSGIPALWLSRAHNADVAPGLAVPEIVSLDELGLG